ncbi:MAG: beta-propeller domain-containing protein [Ruminococcus sp.]|nr:beta-propeller domain-containing protein [Ruminococcus sp.]
MKQNGFTDKLKETTPVPERISPENIEKKLYEKNRSSISVRRRAVSAAAALAIVVGGTTGYLYGTGAFDKKGEIQKSASISYADTAKSSGNSSSGGDSSSQEAVKTYELSGFKNLSYDELNNYLSDYYKDRMSYNDIGVTGAYEQNDIAEDAAMEEDADEEEQSFGTKNATSGTAAKEDSSDHSQTYRQEEGVDEADIVKTDGKNIFYLSSGYVFAIECDDGKMQEHMIDFEEIFGDEFRGGRASEMYLDGGSLTVIINSYDPYEYTCVDDETGDNITRTFDRDSVNVITFDVTDLNDIKQTGKYTIQGWYVTSRMIDGKLYLASNSGVSYYGTYEDGGTPEFAPVYSVNGEMHYVNSGDIFVPETPNGSSYTNLSLINTRAGCEPASIKTFFGINHEIYQTTDRLFLVGTQWDDSDEDNWEFSTRMISIDTTDGILEPLASGTVEGSVNDKYSLNYSDGVLSVVTNVEHYDSKTYESTLENYLYTLDDNMEVIGKTEAFGDGEVVKSVTFKDNYAYVVTFMQTDPLFAIDLSDPKKPTIVSELKMPGFSSHMRAFGEGRIVGFGNTADEETGWSTGLKLSVYDNSDPDNVKELANVELNETDDNYSEVYYSSAAEYDVKALLIDSDKNIIAFPYYADFYNYKDYYEDDDDFDDTLDGKVISGYRFYSFSDEDGLTLIGEYKDERTYTGYDYASDVKGFVRAAYIGDVYYLFHNKGVVSVDKDTFEEIDSKDLSALYKNDTVSPYINDWAIVD